MQLNNLIYISAAGSGKTTKLVEEALKNKDKKILIVTYTINNLNEIINCFYKKISCIPSNVCIQSWFSFLLSEGVRPYQSFLYDRKRIKSIEFYCGISAKYISKKDIRYFLKNKEYIYTDKISEFICICNELSNGLVISRLEEIYDSIYIDEVQDLAGYDFDFLEILINSKINTIFVGDNRQATFSTNNSRKYRKFKGKNIIDLFKIWEKEDRCKIDYLKECYRCNQKICDLADYLYPEMPKTISLNEKITGHDGNFIVRKKYLNHYVNKYNPTALRYNVRTKCNDICAINFRISKGLTFDRVIIFPNKSITRFLKTGELKYIEPSKCTLYVAITRARYSVAFLCDERCSIENIDLYSP